MPLMRRERFQKVEKLQLELIMFSKRLCNYCDSWPSASPRWKDRQALPSEFLGVPRYLVPYSLWPGVTEP